MLRTNHKQSRNPKRVQAFVAISCVLASPFASNAFALNSPAQTARPWCSHVTFKTRNVEPVSFHAHRGVGETHRRSQRVFRQIKTRALLNDSTDTTMRLFDDDSDSHVGATIDGSYQIMPENIWNENKKKRNSLEELKDRNHKSFYDQQPMKQPTWILQYAQHQMKKLKQTTQSIIDMPVVECVGAALILFSSLLVAVTTLPNIPAGMLQPVEEVQKILAYLFLVEFLMRWFSSTEEKGRYVTQPLVMVDVIVVVLPLLLEIPVLNDVFPDIISGQSGLINLRLLRVLRLQRVLKDEATFSRFLYSVKLMPRQKLLSPDTVVQQWELQLARVLLSIFTLLSVAAGLIYTAEHTINPEIDDYFTALYFTLTTLTTVGFGDITPMTWQGKLIVSCSILGGITIIPSQAAALLEALLQRDEEEKRKKEGMEQSRRMLQSTSSRSMAGVSSLEQDSALVSDITLQATKKCPVCNAGLHWSHATYCYNCGSPLKSEPTSILPEL